MSKRGKHYNAELKQKVLQELRSKAVSEVSEAYRISSQTLYSWKRVEQGQSNAMARSDTAALRKENAELRRKNRELKIEREI